MPWLGSTIIGRWLSSLTKGMMLRSRVFRVAVSKVRMPRSQRMTLGLPLERMYSAAERNSSRRAERPRLRSMGFWSLPTARRSSKFCMLREPIWMMSA